MPCTSLPPSSMAGNAEEEEEEEEGAEVTAKKAYLWRGGDDITGLPFAWRTRGYR